MDSLDTILRECCKYAGIEPKSPCNALERIQQAPWDAHPPAAEVVAKLKAWLEGNEIPYQTGWGCGKKAHFAKIYADAAVFGLAGSTTLGATETEAFLRAFHAAFVGKERE